MRLHVSAGHELPIYRQIMRQVTDAIASGRLAAGDKLPSHRELAAQLVIAPLTVKKAYDEMERDGLIRTERGRGTFVASGTRQIDPAALRDRFRAPVRALLSRAHLGGMPVDELVRLIRELDAELRAQRIGCGDDG